MKTLCRENCLFPSVPRCGITVRQRRSAVARFGFSTHEGDQFIAEALEIPGVRGVLGLSSKPSHLSEATKPPRGSVAYIFSRFAQEYRALIGDLAQTLANVGVPRPAPSCGSSWATSTPRRPTTRSNYG